MRLETPVTYFYPPKSIKTPMSIDVGVSFRGGWLTEFYPNATVVAPDPGKGQLRFSRLTDQTVGRLEWKGLQVGVHSTVPLTSSAVWLAPRQVQAVNVQNSVGESERTSSIAVSAISNRRYAFRPTRV